MPERVLLAMSGGVDSSVAAYLLHEQGYEVIGLFMRTGVHEEVPRATGCSLPVLGPADSAHRPAHKRGCCSAADAADARRVADMLDIPFYALDFEHDFGRIMDYFVEEYTHGRTPNPCVMCNNWLKFGRLWEYAQQIGADYVATGHYARIAPVNKDAQAAKCSVLSTQYSWIPAQHSEGNPHHAACTDHGPPPQNLDCGPISPSAPQIDPPPDSTARVRSWTRPIGRAHV